MHLFEREAALANLELALASALSGHGRVALVSGEAGVGKTALVQHFAHRHRASVRVLWGACDDLITPRPLGPLHDMASQVGGDLPVALAGEAERPVVLSAMLAALQHRPTLAVFEDGHWADEATLDLLRFLGRRIGRTHAMLVLTYRDDELGPTHALRPVVGDLVCQGVAVRIDLAPLSEEAVRLLVGDGAAPRAVYAAEVNPQ